MIGSEVSCIMGSVVEVSTAESPNRRIYQQGADFWQKSRAQPQKITKANPT